ncbi:aspartate kinase [Mesonia sp. K7]|uniref:aspartate kinase n=1 Tax=Mesonia sp. K7 TaxID=2218606 RepID=UPI000DA70DDA|nr:aspartate kinase [Mesonia sp. K7]PZD76659.1 aspartate kinase [Mesonia sp. K7]
MSANKTIHLVIFGIGNVGSTLIHQIQQAKPVLSEKGIDLNILIITNSKHAFYKKEGISATWEIDFKQFSVPYQIEDIIAFVKEQNYQNLIAIDATASRDFVENYIPLIENGFHLVSANKIANTLKYKFYENLRWTLKAHRKKFLYETNVGAGLPVIDTIRNLYYSGEKILKIRGVFSGSLSYLFNIYSEENIAFSKVLRKAEKLGYTEPDFREDLSGNDVARKLLILARELNLKVEFSDVKIQSLVPKFLNGKLTTEQFKQRLHEMDVPYFRKKDALSKDKVLRYVGELDVEQKTLEVKLVSETKNSALGQLKGADSVFEIFTESYGNLPLVIQGAGAGNAVTARGVLSDILIIANGIISSQFTPNEKEVFVESEYSEIK